MKRMIVFFLRNKIGKTIKSAVSSIAIGYVVRNYVTPFIMKLLF